MRELHLSKRLVTSIIFASLFLLIPALIDFTGYHTQRFLLQQKPTDDFFVYYSVEPFKYSYAFDDDLKMLSDSEVLRHLDFSWNDILFCEYDSNPGELVNVASAEDERYYEGNVPDSARAPNVGSVQSSNNKEPQERDVRTWVLQIDKPKEPGTCLVQANTCADVGNGVIKCQTITSKNAFRIE